MLIVKTLGVEKLQGPEIYEQDHKTPIIRRVRRDPYPQSRKVILRFRRSEYEKCRERNRK